MANPQLNNGYTRIANEILERTMKISLNGTQLRLVMAVWRYTYGFQRKHHELSIRFLAESIDAARSQVDRELANLIERKIIMVFGNGGIKGGRSLGFNKNHREWQGLPTRSGEYGSPAKVEENKPIKKVAKDTGKPKKYDEDDTYLKMATYFHRRVSAVANDAGISHLTKRSNMQNWADDMRKIVEIDGIEKKLAKDVMDWVTQDSFWRTNILSAKKLREKFMELAIKMNAESKPKQENKVYDPRDREVELQRWITDGNNPEEFDWETGRARKNE